MHALVRCPPQALEFSDANVRLQQAIRELDPFRHRLTAIYLGEKCGTFLGIDKHFELAFRRADNDPGKRPLFPTVRPPM
jgi:hypothetical protein